MAAFHEVRFPADISLGASGGPGFHTTVLILSNGYERRNIDWARARATYDVSHAVKTSEQMNELIHFFQARRGRAYGFRFKDWTDYKMPYWETTPGDVDDMPLQLITTGTSTPTTFQLTKPYGDEGSTFYRLIRKPVSGTLNLYADDELTTDWTVDTTTGIVTLGAALRATEDVEIRATCQFDVPVRFDTDQMKISLANYKIEDWSGIPLIEIRV